MTWIQSRGSRDKTRSNTAVAIFQSSLMSKSTSWIWFTASHSAVMPSFIAKVKHRHRFCSATHRIQLRKWLASVKKADSSFTGLLLACYSPTDSDSDSASASGSGPLPLALTLSLTLRLGVSSTTTVRLRFTCDEFIG